MDESETKSRKKQILITAIAVILTLIFLTVYNHYAEQHAIKNAHTLNDKFTGTVQQITQDSEGWHIIKINETKRILLTDTCSHIPSVNDTIHCVNKKYYNTNHTCTNKYECDII